MNVLLLWFIVPLVALLVALRRALAFRLHFGRLVSVSALLSSKSALSQTVTCATDCTITVVHEFSIPPMQLDEAGGLAIAGAVLAIWALGFGFRALIQAVRKTDGVSSGD